MGLGAASVRAMFAELIRRPFEGRVITLGVQDIFLTKDDLIAIAGEYGEYPLTNFHLSEKPALAADGFISDECLFSSLGFSETIRLDASDYEGAEIVHDLNLPLDEALPATTYDVGGSCDVVIDGGTIEHVFNVPSALRNIFMLLKVGGRVIHCVAPSSNHMDHGFYMFSPTLFVDYYLANKFDINTFKIVKYWLETRNKWETLDYVPGSLLPISMGGLDDACYGIYLVATKTAASSWEVVPQQGMYANYLWRPDHIDVSVAAVGASSESDAAVNSLTTRLFFRPSDPVLLVQRMKARLHVGDLAAALVDADAAVAVLPSDVSLRRERAEIHRALQSWDDALADYSAAIALNAADGLLYRRRATLLHALGRHSQAADDRKRALAALSGADREILRGEFALEDGNINKAIAAFASALRERPKDEGILSWRVIAHSAAGNLTAALADAEAAVALAPNNAGLVAQRADVRLRLANQR